MPLSQLPLPSFTLALSDSVCLRDFQRAHNREIQIPVYALSGDENLMRTVDLRSAPAQASSFIVYKSEYYLDPDAASLFGDAREERLISEGFLWRRLPESGPAEDQGLWRQTLHCLSVFLLLMLKTLALTLALCHCQSHYQCFAAFFCIIYIALHYLLIDASFPFLRVVYYIALIMILII